MNEQQIMERAIVEKAQLAEQNQLLMAIIAFLVKDKKQFKDEDVFELGMSQLQSAPAIKIEGDGETLRLARA